MGVLTKDGDLGYYPIGDKCICSDCFDDYAIKSYIETEAVSNKCDYCQAESSEPIAAYMDVVINFILDGISTEWGDPGNEGVPWEGGWVWPVKDSHDLIHFEIELHANPVAIHEIKNSILDREWVKKDYKGADPMLSAWELFVYEVKHKRRYFFGLKEEEQFSFGILPSQFLNRLGKEITELSLVKSIKTTDIIYRTRIDDPSITFLTAAKLGTPSYDKAKYTNRMSPAGIPMFYGSFDVDTTIKETFHEKDTRPAVAIIAKFMPLREIKVLDLTSMPDTPSIFDENRGYLRSNIIFLKSFVEDLSKPIEKDEKIHIEYVPTQVFTEYIRHVYKDENHGKLGGIIYPSSVHPSGISCVLFVENEECCDRGAAERIGKPYVLVLVDAKRQNIP